jgi:hypothetical protein
MSSAVVDLDGRPAQGRGPQTNDLVFQLRKDATAAPRHPTLGDGYPAAPVNYDFIANAVLTTEEAVAAMP